MADTFDAYARQLMGERGISLRKLAKVVPCDTGHLSKLVNGRKRPSPEMATRIDAALDAGGDLAALVPTRQERDTHLPL